MDLKIFRKVLGHYASGITVVTGMAQEEPVGFTCQSFHSVSMDPPLVSLCVMKSSTSWPKISRIGRFCVNVLAEEQMHVSNAFARSGTDKWTGIEWHISTAGNPVIADCLIWLECETYSELEAGDHVIVLGRVTQMINAETVLDNKPLIYFKGSYHQISAL